MAYIIIDPSSLRKIKDNYKVIEREIDFLSFFDSNDNLWIKGEEISNWAKNFYANRGIDFKELPSPYIEIERILHIPTKDMPYELIEQIMEVIENNEEYNISLSFILKEITGEAFWEQNVSWEHLLSILFKEISDNLKSLIHYQVLTWENSITDNDMKGLYDQWYNNREILIKSWLGMYDNIPLWRNKVKLKPHNIPQKWLDIYKDYWSQNIFLTEGNTLIKIISDMQYDMKAISEIAFNYFVIRPDTYDKEYYNIISPYLSIQQKKELLIKGKLDDLRPFPDAPNTSEIVEWCIDYLKHKKICLLNESRNEDYYEEYANKFSKWFLENYSTFRNTSIEETPINIRVRKIVSEYLKKGPVFWVIIDGLGYLEHELLINLICQQDSKIGLELGPVPLYSVVPSITCIAKWSLITGRYFVDAEKDNESLKDVFYKTWQDSFYATDQKINELQEQLKNGNKSLYCYDTTTLDTLFHNNLNFKTLINMVESHLEGLSKIIIQNLKLHPNYQDISLIISGDHGQILGYSPVIPKHYMEENLAGRVLFEKPVDWDENISHLSPHTYGLKKDSWILHSHENFGAKKEDNGKAVGVHGGAFPEELTVACSVLRNNPTYKPLDINIEGNGYSKAGGKIEITISNNNDIPVENITIFIKELAMDSNRFCINKDILPLSKKTFTYIIDECPSTDDGQLILTGFCEYQLLGRSIESQKINGSFKLQEMYKKTTGLLDDF